MVFYYKVRIYIYTGCVKMVLISVNVTPEMYEYKKKKSLNWKGLILEGLESTEIRTKLATLQNEYDSLVKDYEKLDLEQKLRGKKLAKYVEKYGIDEDIIYKIKE